MSDDITENFHGGNERSEEANASWRRAAKRRLRSRIIGHIFARGPVTCDEAEAALGMSHQTCSARFTELKRDGVLRATGERRLTRNGRKADVFTLSSLA